MSLTRSVLGAVNPDGVEVYEPGAYSRTVPKVDVRKNGPGTARLVYIGRSIWGPPSDENGLPVQLSSHNDAVDVLGLCPITDYMSSSWDPSPDPQWRGANTIDYIRAGTIARSTLNLVASAVTVMTATSRKYGEAANKYQTKVETGSVSGTKKVSTRYSNQTPQVYDKLGKALYIEYTGGGSSCELNIAWNSSDLAVSFYTDCDVPADNILIDLADFPTISALAAFIDAQDTYSAYVDSANGADGTMPSAYLDEQTEADITSGLDAGAAIGAILWATRNDPHIQFARSATKATPPDNLAWTYLSGGDGDIDDTLSASDITTALDFLESSNIPGGKLFVETDSTALQLVVKSWINLQRTNNNRRWRLWTAAAASASGSQTTLSTRTTQGQAVNSPHVSMVGEAPKFLNYLGEYENNALRYAALLAGFDAGSGLIAPLTWKPVNVLGGELCSGKPPTKAQREAGIRAGLISLYRNELTGAGWINNLVVTSSSATDQRPNYITAERNIIDAIDDSIVQNMERKFPGSFGTLALLTAVREEAEATLNQWTRPPYERLVGNPDDPDSRPFQIISVTINGGIADIEWSGYISPEVDHVFSRGTVSYRKLVSRVSVPVVR